MNSQMVKDLKIEVAISDLEHFVEQKEKEDKLEMKLSSEDFHLTKIIANKDELNEHDAKLKDMQERNSIEPIWRKF